MINLHYVPVLNFSPLSPTLPKEELCKHGSDRHVTPQQKMLSGSLFSLWKCPQMLAPCSQPLPATITLGFLYLIKYIPLTTLHTFYSASLNHFSSDSAMLFPAFIYAHNALYLAGTFLFLVYIWWISVVRYLHLKTLFLTPSAFQALLGCFILIIHLFHSRGVCLLHNQPATIQG